MEDVVCRQSLQLASIVDDAASVRSACARDVYHTTVYASSHVKHTSSDDSSGGAEALQRSAIAQVSVPVCCRRVVSVATHRLASCCRLQAVVLVVDILADAWDPALIAHVIAESVGDDPLSSRAGYRRPDADTGAGAGSGAGAGAGAGSGSGGGCGDGTGAGAGTRPSNSSDMFASLSHTPSDEYEAATLLSHLRSLLLSLWLVHCRDATSAWYSAASGGVCSGLSRDVAGSASASAASGAGASASVAAAAAAAAHAGTTSVAVGSGAGSWPPVAVDSPLSPLAGSRQSVASSSRPTDAAAAADARVRERVSLELARAAARTALLGKTTHTVRPHCFRSCHGCLHS